MLLSDVCPGWQDIDETEGPKSPPHGTNSRSRSPSPSGQRQQMGEQRRPVHGADHPRAAGRVCGAHPRL